MVAGLLLLLLQTQGPGALVAWLQFLPSKSQQESGQNWEGKGEGEGKEVQ